MFKNHLITGLPTLEMNRSYYNIILGWWMTFLIGCLVDEINGTETAEVLEVDQGDLAILNCPSNDDDHRFQFWMINTKDYIGPGSNIDHTKYKYEVLTGTLYIKEVSTAEHGVYTCFCRHLTGLTYNVKSVELIVKRNWEDVYEHDASTNTFRIVILLVVIIILMVILFGILYLQRRKTPIFADMFDEESPDEDRPHTSFQRMVNSTNTIDTQGLDGGLDTHSLDTELPKEFQTRAIISNR